MTRKERIAHDRIEMIKRALVHAGYLSLKETDDEKKHIDFKEVMGSVLADLLHLRKQEYGLKLSDDPVEIIKTARHIGEEAGKHFAKEREEAVDPQSPR